MHRYFIKTSWLVKKIFSSYYWSLPANENAVYLTFDDGPHPTITPWVLNELNQHGAKATFFCIGDNVLKYREVYQKILEEGHAVGNHTFHHMNGWKTKSNEYLNDISKAAEVIQTNLFRPPYGKIKSSQAKKVADAMNISNPKIIMWDVLSADFDSTFSPDQCLHNVIDNVSAGSIIVFHDSEKAFRSLKYVLPLTLQALKKQGFQLEKIEL